jgi:hypothetical protein
VEHIVFEWTVAALALVALGTNLLISWRMYLVLKALLAQIEATRKQVEPILEQAQEVLAETKQGVTATLERTQASVYAITAAAEEITDIVREQVIEARAAGKDSVLAVRNQVERLDDLVIRTVARVDQTVSIIQKQVLEPVREFHYLMVAVRRALNVFFGRSSKRQDADRAYQDEELFI